MSYVVKDAYGQAVGRWELRGDGVYELRDTFGRPTESYNPGTREYVDAKGIRSTRMNEPWGRPTSGRLSEANPVSRNQMR